jgi:hypothetical protein
MLKHLPIYAALMALTAVPLYAEEREAVLQRGGVPGSAFDVILALPKPQAAIINLTKSPDAFVVHLAGGELALAFESGEEMLQALDSLRTPFGAFHIQESCSNSFVPAAVYIVPKDHARASVKD